MRSRNHTALFAVLLLAVALPATAAKKPRQKATDESVAAATAPESAQVIRETALKKEPFTDAETISTLPEQATVKILTRQGAWMQVQAGEVTGWLRLLSLRTTAASGASGDSGLNAAINVARSGASGNTVATGVRGLSKEQISNASPNTAELDKMSSYAVDDAKARAFAAQGQVTEAEVPFLASGDN